MNANLKAGIIGIGMVGGPLARYFLEIRGSRRGSDLFLSDIARAKGYTDDPNQADVVFICVPTPRSSSGAVELSAVANAFEQLTRPTIAVIKSTVPPGTSEYFQQRFPRHKVLFNPEFLTEAHAWEETLHPSRQLVGHTATSKDVGPAVLALLPKSDFSAPSPGFSLTATEAEIVKYAANVFLARKVTFANAIFNIAERHGADYDTIRKSVAADPRIGGSHLDVQHGGYRGYGGYCFVKDVDGLIAHCASNDLGPVADLFLADRDFNSDILASQGLTPEDVSVHDHEWLEKKLKKTENRK